MAVYPAGKDGAVVLPDRNPHATIRSLADGPVTNVIVLTLACPLPSMKDICACARTEESSIMPAHSKADDVSLVRRCWVLKLMA
jgi:hypothetical protein